MQLYPPQSTPLDPSPLTPQTDLDLLRNLRDSIKRGEHPLFRVPARPLPLPVREPQEAELQQQVDVDPKVTTPSSDDQHQVAQDPVPSHQQDSEQAVNESEEPAHPSKPELASTSSRAASADLAQVPSRPPADVEILELPDYISADEQERDVQADDGDSVSSVDGVDIMDEDESLIAGSTASNTEQTQDVVKSPLLEPEALSTIAADIGDTDMVSLGQVSSASDAGDEEEHVQPQQLEQAQDDSVPPPTDLTNTPRDASSTSSEQQQAQPIEPVESAATPTQLSLPSHPLPAKPTDVLSPASSTFFMSSQADSVSLPSATSQPSQQCLTPAARNASLLAQRLAREKAASSSAADLALAAPVAIPALPPIPPVEEAKRFLLDVNSDPDRQAKDELVKRKANEAKHKFDKMVENGAAVAGEKRPGTADLRDAAEGGKKQRVSHDERDWPDRPQSQHSRPGAYDERGRGRGRGAGWGAGRGGRGRGGGGMGRRSLSPPPPSTYAEYSAHPRDRERGYPVPLPSLPPSRSRDDFYDAPPPRPHPPSAGPYRSGPPSESDFYAPPPPRPRSPTGPPLHPNDRRFSGDFARGPPPPFPPTHGPPAFPPRYDDRDRESYYNSREPPSSRAASAGGFAGMGPPLPPSPPLPMPRGRPPQYKDERGPPLPPSQGMLGMSSGGRPPSVRSLSPSRNQNNSRGRSRSPPPLRRGGPPPPSHPSHLPPGPPPPSAASFDYEPRYGTAPLHSYAPSHPHPQQREFRDPYGPSRDIRERETVERERGYGPRPPGTVYPNLPPSGPPLGSRGASGYAGEGRAGGYGGLDERDRRGPPMPVGGRERDFEREREFERERGVASAYESRERGPPPSFVHPGPPLPSHPGEPRPAYYNDPRHISRLGAPLPVSRPPSRGDPYYDAPFPPPQAGYSAYPPVAGGEHILRKGFDMPYGSAGAVGHPVYQQRGPPPSHPEPVFDGYSGYDDREMRGPPPPPLGREREYDDRRGGREREFRDDRSVSSAGTGGGGGGGGGGGYDGRGRGRGRGAVDRGGGGRGRGARGRGG